METESHGSVESRTFGALRALGRLFPSGNSSSATKQRTVRSASNATSMSTRSDAPPGSSKSKSKSKKRSSLRAEASSSAKSVQSTKGSQTHSEAVDSPSSGRAGSGLFNLRRPRSSKQQRATNTNTTATGWHGDASSANSSGLNTKPEPRTSLKAVAGTVVADVHASAGPSASVYSNSSADSSLHSAVLTAGTKAQSSVAFGFGTPQPTLQPMPLTCDAEDELLANVTEKSSISLSSSALQSVHGAGSQLRGAGGVFECPLCLNEVVAESVPRLLNCRHRACRSCLCFYLRTEITEGRVQIACPTCSERLHPTDIEQLLVDQPRLIEKYSEFMVRRVLLNDPDARWCPAPDCGYAVIANACGACPELICERPGCGTHFCYHCKSYWHTDGRPCPVLRFAAQSHSKERGSQRDRGAFPNPAALLRAAPSGLRELVDVTTMQSPGMPSTAAQSSGQTALMNLEAAGGNAATRTSWSAASVAVSSVERGAVSEVKPCPRCGALIIKMQDGSCNHMTCILCGAEFCWLCLREISDWHYLSPSGCTFWGKRVWSRKKKILWQLGILIGAPLFIALMATVSVPAILIGVPIWVGKKLHAANATRSKRRRTLTVTAGVLGAVALSPVLATFAVSIGVPVLLAYVYGVIPISLCKSNACGSGGSLDDDESAPPPLRFFEDDSALAQRSNALQSAPGHATAALDNGTSRISGMSKTDDDAAGTSRLSGVRDEQPPTLNLGDTPSEHRAATRGVSRTLQAAAASTSRSVGANVDECDESAIVSSVSVGDACSAAGSLGGPAILLGGDSATVDTASASADDNALFLHAVAASKKRVTIGGQHCHPHSASFEYAEAETDADVDVPIDGVTVRVVQPADCDTDDADRPRDTDAEPDCGEEHTANCGSLKKQLGKASRSRSAVRHASFSKRRDTRPSTNTASCLVQSPSSAGAPTMMSSIGDVSSCVSYSQIVAADCEPSAAGDHDHRAASSCGKSDARGECAIDDPDADRESASRRALIGTSCEPSLNGDAASMRSGKMVLTPSDADDEKRLVSSSRGGDGGSKMALVSTNRDESELAAERAADTLNGALRQRHAATPTMLNGVGNEYDDAALLTQDNASTKCLPGSLLINMDTFSIRDTSIILDDVSSLNNVLNERVIIASPHADGDIYDADRRSERDMDERDARGAERH